MKLQQLITNQLHETINLNIIFKEDITLLVGINGCGKTSALNVIDWLLKPDLKRLAITLFFKVLTTCSCSTTSLKTRGLHFLYFKSRKNRY